MSKVYAAKRAFISPNKASASAAAYSITLNGESVEGSMQLSSEQGAGIEIWVWGRPSHGADDKRHWRESIKKARNVASIFTEFADKCEAALEEVSK